MKIFFANDVVTITYPCGKYSRVETNEAHAFHAAKLNILPAEYNLLHEIAHQLIAHHYGYDTCPIVYNSAHALPLPADAHIIEWRITALTYFAFSKPQHDSNGFKACVQIHKKGNIFVLARKLRYEFEKLRYGSTIRK